MHVSQRAGAVHICHVFLFSPVYTFLFTFWFNKTNVQFALENIVVSYHMTGCGWSLDLACHSSELIIDNLDTMRKA